ncbi:MAG: hypothetical protein R6V50_02305 [Thermoplasmatota archaeon]
MTSITYHRQFRQNLINRLGKRCYRCGYPYDLEFHHKGGNGNSHSIGGWQQLYKIKYELRKEHDVILLCHECHLEYHRREYWK